MGRLGVLGRANDLLARFEAGPNPFDGGNWAGRVRHVAPLVSGNTLYVFFSGQRTTLPSGAFVHMDH